MTTDLSPETALFARRLARRHARRLPSQVDPADLIPIALFAAWRAEQRFDPAKGCKRTTWIMNEVQRALLDHDRKEDHLTREQRRDFEREGSPQYLLPTWIDRPAFEGEDQYETLGDLRPGCPEIDREGMTAGLWASLAGEMLAPFPVRIREIFHRSYWREETLPEIGRAMGLGDRWVGELRREALKQLRESYEWLNR